MCVCVDIKKDKDIHIYIYTHLLIWIWKNNDNHHSHTVKHTHICIWIYVYYIYIYYRYIYIYMYRYVYMYIYIYRQCCHKDDKLGVFFQEWHQALQELQAKMFSTIWVPLKWIHGYRWIIHVNIWLWYGYDMVMIWFLYGQWRCIMVYNGNFPSCEYSTSILKLLVLRAWPAWLTTYTPMPH